MNRPFRSLVLLGICAVGFAFVAGCVSQKAIDSYQARLKALEEKGVPDSLLSSIRVYITQANEGKKSANGLVVKASMDSLKVCVAAAEKWSDDLVATAKPRVEALQKTFAEQKTKLTGLQLKAADSLIALINSYVQKNWYLQAEAVAGHCDTVMPQLLKDEAIAQKVAAIVPGTWTKNKKHTENGANEIEKGFVTFEKDGTFKMEEQMVGMKSPSTKEDWQIQSQGVYGIKGDTVLLSIKTEQYLRGNFENLVNDKWVKNENKRRDTTYNPPHEQFFTIDYLKDLYKKK
jgi:hypothetical protein